VGTLTVFHGTGAYNLGNIVSEGPKVRSRVYVPRPSFCTTTDFQVAMTFAFRKTSSEDYLKGLITGVVLEYELTGIEGKDYLPVADPRCMLDEKEVAVCNTKTLNLKAVWRYEEEQWQRKQR
jgi:hypothetical protein